jgi:serine/threonine protein kinase
VPEAVKILRDVARALDFAHERGVVHRDIKPENILVTGESATVTDFGISKALDASRTPGQTGTLTEIGFAVGTPQYMSPEQLEGKPVDARADIFAFGAVLYEMIAGRRPFEAKSQAGLVEAILDHDPPSVAAVRPATPPLLAELIATPASDESPSLSPDGRWLVYESNESGASQVYLRPFPEVSQGRWQLSTAGGVDPSWSRDGREVIFLEIATSGAAQPRAILSVSIPPGPPFVPAAPRLVVKYPANAARGFAEAADGRFLLSVPASSGDDEPAARPRIVVVQNWREELARLVPVR